MDRTRSSITGGFLSFLAAVVSFAGTCAAFTTAKPEEEDNHWVFWADLGARIAFISIIIVGCGMFSLVAWCVCAIHTKLRKDRVQGQPGTNIMALPVWSHSLMMDPDLQLSGFQDLSDGVHCHVTHNHVIRHRVGTAKTDGARWGTGLTSGKHVFEVQWSWNARGSTATVGLGTGGAPLVGKGEVSLVGMTHQSWGLDLFKRRIVHNKRLFKACPTDGSYVPDKFFMFVDLDNRMMGFGNDVNFWGFVVENIRVSSGEPLYVMIGSCKPNAEVQVFYKGTHCPGGFDMFTSAGAAPGTSMAEAPPSYNDIHRLPPLPPGVTFKANSETQETKGTGARDGSPSKGHRDNTSTMISEGSLPPAPNNRALYAEPPPPYQGVPDAPQYGTS